MPTYNAGIHTDGMHGSPDSVMYNLYMQITRYKSGYARLMTLDRACAEGSDIIFIPEFVLTPPPHHHPQKKVEQLSACIPDI